MRRSEVNLKLTFWRNNLFFKLKISTQNPSKNLGSTESWNLFKYHIRLIQNAQRTFTLINTIIRKPFPIMHFSHMEINVNWKIYTINKINLQRKSSKCNQKNSFEVFSRFYLFQINKESNKKGMISEKFYKQRQ